MRSDRVAPVAIIGGGASGTIIAAQLARRDIESVLIEGRRRVGKGIAYSTMEAAHLLNVCADGMSAWAGDPDHFARRCMAEGGEGDDFAERRFFGRYLGEILQEAIASGNTRVIDGLAVGADRHAGRWQIHLDGGAVVEASGLVLAIGNQEPDTPRALVNAGPHLIDNPWGEEAAAAVRELSAEGGNALIIGTGLTMVDLVLSLDAGGFEGRILALSRRGQVPRSHADFDLVPVAQDDVPHGNVRALWRWLRRQSARVGWRAAVDSLRPHSHALWQSFDEEEQRRFLRHARPWWDVHRHRIAPQVAATVARAVSEGRMEVIAGKIVSARQSGQGIDVEVRRRGAEGSQTMHFDYAFNCTGPLHAMSHTKDRLLRSLLDAGEVRPDQLDIGIAVDDHARVAGAERLWALGPLTKGRYWEIIAVPDIREQAAAVADDIERELANERTW